MIMDGTNIINTNMVATTTPTEGIPNAPIISTMNDANIEAIQRVKFYEESAKVSSCMRVICWEVANAGILIAFAGIVAMFMGNTMAPIAIGSGAGMTALAEMFKAMQAKFDNTK